jgi:pimeloyl-ACP methyl ester carboxylesterase
MHDNGASVEHNTHNHRPQIRPRARNSAAEDQSAMHPPHSTRLSTGALTYFVHGEGRPLLYLHPAGGMRWTKPLEALAKTHRLYVPVMPGFDSTAKHVDVTTMKALATLVGEFVDQVVQTECDVIGQSFGGWVACWLTVLRPERVAQLVLECPAGFRLEGQGARPMDAEALKRALFLYPEKLPPGGKTLEVEAANRTMLAHYHATIAMDQELLGRLGEIDQLTLILHGSADTLIPKESVQLLRSKLKHAFLVYVYDAAHNIEVDQPERFQRLVEDFLARSEAFMVNWASVSAQSA